MSNLTNCVLLEWRDGSSGVTLILYTAHSRTWITVPTGDEGQIDLKIVTQLQRGNGWGCEAPRIRRLITDKRRQRSIFVERLVKLDQESYERHASVGARGEPIGN